MYITSMYHYTPLEVEGLHYLVGVQLLGTVRNSCKHSGDHTLDIMWRNIMPRGS